VAYTLGCTPAPLTFTIRPKLQWQVVLTLAWFAFIGYRVYLHDWNGIGEPDRIFDTILLGFVSLGAVLALIRRERVEIYSSELVWRKTYFGFTRSTAAPLNDVLGAQWNEGQQRGRQGKGPDYVEFFLASGDTVKACYGFTFDDFDRFREDIRSMFPDVVKRWGAASVRSKDLTLLNLS
jgi:hypothetical protein